MKTEVVDRDPRTGPRSAGKTNDTTSPVKLMYNTVRGYVSAIVALWSHQITMKLHNAPHPHRVAIKALGSLVLRRQRLQQRAEFADRTVGTIKDGYTASQIPKVCAAAFSETGAKAVEPALRTWVDFLFGNSMLLRSNNKLSMNLPDLFVEYLEHEGPAGAERPVFCVVALLDHGKSTFAIS